MEKWRGRRREIRAEGEGTEENSMNKNGRLLEGKQDLGI